MNEAIWMHAIGFDRVLPTVSKGITPQVSGEGAKEVKVVFSLCKTNGSYPITVSVSMTKTGKVCLQVYRDNIYKVFNLTLSKGKIMRMTIKNKRLLARIKREDRWLTRGEYEKVYASRRGNNK